MTQEPKWNGSRMLGKSVASYIQFFEEGKKGKAVIYATPEGNFLSPKAVENTIQSQREEEVKAIEECMKRKEIVNGCQYEDELQRKIYFEGFEDGRAMMIIDLGNVLSILRKQQ